MMGDQFRGRPFFWSNMPTLRAIAICLFRHNGRILVGEGVDHVKNEVFYRPLGGSIEFGEYSKETIHREIMEEIGTTVKDLNYLGLLENIFTYEGHKGHEIVLVYDGSFIDETLYKEEVIEGDELGWPFRAYWKKLSEFGPDKPLYPDGLLEMLLNEE
jgi:8-oxo-dGTP pyrophosphatase MutT (NUDIX family)